MKRSNVVSGLGTLLSSDLSKTDIILQYHFRIKPGRNYNRGGWLEGHFDPIAPDQFQALFEMKTPIYLLLENGNKAEISFTKGTPGQNLAVEWQKTESQYHILLQMSSKYELK